MACRISELVLKCRAPEALARFWCEVLDFTELDREEGVLIEIGPREGFGGPQPTIILIRSDEPKNGHARLHFDVNPTDRDQDAELERLLGAGATLVDIGQPAEASWHVLADPEGNEFCLLKRRLDPL
jgi:catechol 2,3-dioxygenase-like lactoylglutathione lyase family enzyme